MAHRVFITVAEVSGDKHAAQLIRSLRRLDPDILIEGFGGPEMAAAGAIIHRNTVAQAAMGWRGAFRAAEVLRALKWAKRHFQQHRPDLLIGVDSPSMNFHFARAAHEQGIPVLQYVAPQLWAWAQWRMKKLRRWVDQVACILPFEEAYFRGHGVNAVFVGHPLFDELPSDRGQDRDRTFPARPPVVGLLTGSRRSEAQANFPGLLAAAQIIAAKFPGASFLIPTTPATDPVVEAELKNKLRARLAALLAGRDGNASPDDESPASAASPDQFQHGVNQFDVMVPKCDLCLTVSGTATLHVAGFHVPMIVVYRVSRLIWHAAGRWLVPTRTFALVNLLAENPTTPSDHPPATHLVPEFVPWHGSGEPVAQLAIEMLSHPEQLAAQRTKLAELIRVLDHPGASDKTARLALEMMNAASPTSVAI